MAVAIEVAAGAGLGWRYVLAAEEVRVGRGAGHQVKLDDPSWGGGHLRVLFRHGGYVVTNRMGHAVLLDGRPLADGEQANWFTGTGLQPTGGTLLQLATADRPAGAEAVAGVIAVPPGAGDAARKKRVQNWIAVGVLAVAAAGFGAKQLLKPAPPVPAEVLDAQIGPALAADYRDGRGEEITAAIRKGLVCRSKGDVAGARQKYHDARRLIAALAAPGVEVDKLPPPLAQARRFVDARLDELPAAGDANGRLAP